MRHDGAARMVAHASDIHMPGRELNFYSMLGTGRQRNAFYRKGAHSGCNCVLVRSGERIFET